MEAETPPAATSSWRTGSRAKTPVSPPERRKPTVGRAGVLPKPQSTRASKSSEATAKGTRVPAFKGAYRSGVAKRSDRVGQGVSASAEKPFSRGLPRRPSSFIGREGEIAALSEFVLSSSLLTLTGPAGVGKSRLGLKVAEEAAAGFSDGAWFVELGSLSQPTLVPNAVATAMSVPQERRKSVTESLVGFLRGRRALIVLDNCEHLIGACAQLVDILIASNASIRIMATSQEPLSVAGERVWKVPPLEVPGREDDLEGVAGYEAVQLFCERAAEINNDFKLTPRTAPAVAEIARRLDGIPLAIELAAARVEMLSPEDIAGRLDKRFRLLRGGGRTAMPRHRALEEALDWSYELCTEKEQILLRRLSVFAGSFTLDAAEHVTAGEILAVEDIFELMARLVAKSFVASQVDGPSARYLLLETVREYAAERLVEAGEETRFRKRHAAWFCQFAESAEEHLTGPDQVQWLNRVEAEHDNLRAAIGFLVSRGDEQVLRLTTGLTMFWRVRGHFSEGRKWLEDAISSAGTVGPELRAKALWAAGLLAALLSDAAGATGLAEEALEISRSIGDKKRSVRALNVAGLALLIKEQPEQAIPPFKEAIALAGEAGDDWCLSDSLARLGYAYIRLRQSDAALERFRQCLEVARSTGDTQTLVYGLIGMGWAAMAAGHFSEADAHMSEALELAEQLQQSLELGEALIFLGESARVRGAYESAEGYLRRSEELARRNGSSVLIGRALSGLGRIATVVGDLPAARSYFEEVIAIAREADLPRMLGRGFVGLATAQRGEGLLDEAAKTLDDAFRVLREAGDDIGVAAGILQLGNLNRQKGDEASAARALQKALAWLAEPGDRAGVYECLDAIAGIYSQQGRADQACRIFSATARMREQESLVFQGLPFDRDQAAADLALVRRSLSAEELQEAWRQGTALSIGEVIAYASRGRGARRRPAFGWDSLTPTEIEVVRLVKEGLTNPEIAERLFISPRTVGGHLGHVFAKLGIKTRREVREEAKRHP